MARVRPITSSDYSRSPRAATRAGAEATWGFRPHAPAAFTELEPVGLPATSEGVFKSPGAGAMKIFAREKEFIPIRRTFFAVFRIIGCGPAEFDEARRTPDRSR